MPIDNLLENPYVMSYLNKEKSRLKKSSWEETQKKINFELYVWMNS